jgi:hypothetical protein
LLKLAPTAALLFFAITFFGIMIDVGLFDPLIRLILRFVKNDPMRLVHVKGKGGKDRSVPIEAELLAVIEAYLDSRAIRFLPRSGPST